MAKQARNTFGKLSSTLRSLGFKSIRHGENIVFTHASGRPLILLPAYKSGQAVKPIHLIMVRKQLVDVGMIESGALAIRPRAKAAVKVKSLAKPPLKLKA